MVAAMSFLVNNTPINSVFICYLVKGHTENDADTIHSMIERKKVSAVSVPSEWPLLIKQIQLENVMVDVKTFSYSDFFDVKQFSTNFPNIYKDENGETIINWKQVKIVRINKSDPYKLHFKMSYNAPTYSSINMLQKGGKRSISSVDKRSIPSRMKKAYQRCFSISREKYNDLRNN